MGTESLAPAEPAVREFEATVESVDGREVVLDRTYFYAESGGQPADRGTLAGRTVEDVQVVDGAVVHTLAPVDVDVDGDDDDGTGTGTGTGTAGHRDRPPARRPRRSVHPRRIRVITNTIASINAVSTRPTTIVRRSSRAIRSGASSPASRR
jgi:hypothetical protein